jgi:SAM-dependent methyltransferase
MIYRDKRDLIENKISKEDTVLDVGFWGQGVNIKDVNWAHKIITDSAKETFGVDTEIGEEFLRDTLHYKKEYAEDVVFPIKFDKIVALDLIEHLINPGLFLESCKKNLKEGGELILTTPNTFNLFNLTEKISKHEPTVNPDHTFYFNKKVIKVLLKKCGFSIYEISYVYKLDTKHQESLKKKFLNLVYFVLSKFTEKYIETLVIVAKVDKN